MKETILALFKILKIKINWYYQYLNQQVGPGRRWKYSLKSIIFTAIIYVIKQFTSSYQLTNFLEDRHYPQAEKFRQLRGFDKLGIPDRRTIERRFKNIFHFFRIIIQKMGLTIVSLKIVNKQGRVVDSTRTKAYGNVWHKKQKLKGEIPKCGNIDKEAEWGKNSQGWDYGYNAHIFGSIKPICAPLDLIVKTANMADEVVYEKFIDNLNQSNKYILADGRYDSGKLYKLTGIRKCRLIAGIYKKIGKLATGARKRLFNFLQTDKVKKLYQQRSTSIEPTNRHLKCVFPCLKRATIKGLKNVSLYWHAGTLLYQLAIIYNHQMKRPLKHIKSIIY